MRSFWGTESEIVWTDLRLEFERGTDVCSAKAERWSSFLTKCCRPIACPADRPVKLSSLCGACLRSPEKLSSCSKRFNSASRCRGWTAVRTLKNWIIWWGWKLFKLSKLEESPLQFSVELWSTATMDGGCSKFEQQMQRLPPATPRNNLGHAFPLVFTVNERWFDLSKLGNAFRITSRSTLSNADFLEGIHVYRSFIFWLTSSPR